MLGKRGVHSDTGCEKPGGHVLRAGGPFNYPTEMAPAPNGDLYVTDGYRNCRVHRFSGDGRLKESWGTPGKGDDQYHLPHSIAIDSKGNLYTTEKWEGKRLQKFAYKGIKAVTAGYQGVVRPGATGK